MPNPGDQLRSIKNLEQLVRYLEDELDWPLDGYTVEDASFVYNPTELGLKDEDTYTVNKIYQLRPLVHGQPWGIFFVEFEKKKLPVVVLRRILSHLVVKKRASANKAQAAAWDSSDLLFISAFGEEESDHRELAFAHFHQRDTGDLPTLRVLGWDGDDTSLKLNHVAETLREKLSWPEDTGKQHDWRLRWASAFKHRPGHVIRTANHLAEALAALARRIHAAATTIMEHESDKGHLRTLHKAFREALIHDLTEEAFADTYAQTITYGLLTAAISRTVPGEGTALIADNIVEMVPTTNPFLAEMLQTFLKVGGRKGAIDFDELGIQDVIELLRDKDKTDLPAVLRDFGNRTQGEDPVIHFYEHFLKAYNKKLKVQRGVFYTPQPVVSYIVRSVHELLQTEFGLPDGLASTATWADMLATHPEMKLPTIKQRSKDKAQDSDVPIDPATMFVQILDPATGTATFLVEVINVIHKHLQERWKKGGLAAMPKLPSSPLPTDHRPLFTDYWNAYVPAALLPRLHGYELMMAPYAIAHMKIGLKLQETGFTAWDVLEKQKVRARVYLTNALEPPQDFSSHLAFDAPELAHEAEAVNEIKRGQRFTVVIGNPPYSGISSNMTEYAQRLVDAYKTVDGSALNERKLWLQDDYVKFIRKAQTIIDGTDVGVLGYITNHGYLDNPTFRGMRQSVMGTFPNLCVLDLHGNSNKKEQSPDGSLDKPVFDIKQGVAICLATRSGVESGVLHSELWGSREFKYSWLTNHRCSETAFTPLRPDSPAYMFEPQNTDCRAEYDAGWRISEAMPANCAGFITARDHFVVALDRDTLLERIGDFANLKFSDADIRARYFKGCGSAKYPDGDSRGWKVPQARMRVAGDLEWRDRVRTCLYRPFDSRPIYWADWMVDWPRPEMMRHMLAGNALALSTSRSVEIGSFEHVLCTRLLLGHHTVSMKEVNYMFPLYLLPDEDALHSLVLCPEPEPNFAPAFLKALCTKLKVSHKGPHCLPLGMTPEDIFHYLYAILHSPSYRSRYAEFLKIDFPRLPLTSSLDLFRALATLGGELVALHLLESLKLEESRTRFVGNLQRDVEKVSYANETVWVDKAQTTGFEGVPEAVWNFHIGGYQVCQKWLKDRKGRVLSPEDIAHYHKIVVALSETIRIMAEIDQVIEQHGGWPGAFQGGAAE